jgi:hypothetical protein
MSLSKPWITSFLLIGLGLLAVCPQLSGQTDSNQTITEETLPASQWRQKVLHNYRSSPQRQNASSENTEYRTAQLAPATKQVRPTGASALAYSQQASPRVAQREMPVEMEEDPGTTQYEPLATEGSFASPGNCEQSCGDQCDDQCGDSCDECMECCPWMMWGPRNLGIFGGVHGYKGPRDRGSNGNFGFQEGVNFGAPLGDPWGCGYQLGFAALQSNFSGYQENYPDPNSNLPIYNTVTTDRHQYFFTAGIFRRAECAGWQWGVVFDLLHDTYYEASDLKQIRTETGYLFNEFFEIGYSGAYGIGGDRVQSSTSYVNTVFSSELNQIINRNIDGQLDPTDQFVIYLRRYFCNGGDGRIWGGMTGHGDGLFGADAWVPLGGSWVLQNSFNYLIPKQGRGATVEQNQTNHLEGGQVQESWSVAINLIWYPGRSAHCLGKSCYRPLLNVADNSLFMVRESTEVTTSSEVVYP